MELRSALALSLLPGVGASTHRALVRRHGSALAAWEERSRDAAPAHVAAALGEADRALEAAEKIGAQVLHDGDVRYPRTLSDLDDPPPVLFTHGDLRHLARGVLAMVGTRGCTAYGERAARRIASALARRGIVLASGMARGIDAAAHHAALDAGAGTIAVLGTGIDLAYPSAHRRLHHQIAEHGLLVSEMLPGERPSPGSFPRRNRIIAALASVTLIVEAGHRSGALITATHALELGRVVAAVPGPIDSPASAGANLLLRDGAVVIAHEDDALALMGLAPAASHEPAFHSPAERTVWLTLENGRLSMDALAANAGLPAAECMAAVTALELAGAVECTMTGEVLRR